MRDDAVKFVSLSAYNTFKQFLINNVVYFKFLSIETSGNVFKELIAFVFV